MMLPFGVFWVMLVLSRKELGWLGGLICVALGLGLMGGYLYTSVPLYFVIGQVLLDVFLILKLFGGDIRIN